MSKCKRCGMCCFATECLYGNEDGLWGRCSHLVVNDDLTTACTNKEANAAYVGNGLCPMSSESIRDIYEEMYTKGLEEFKLEYLLLEEGALC